MMLILPVAHLMIAQRRLRSINSESSEENSSADEDYYRNLYNSLYSEDDSDDTSSLRLSSLSLNSFDFDSDSSFDC